MRVVGRMLLNSGDLTVAFCCQCEALVGEESESFKVVRLREFRINTQRIVRFIECSYVVPGGMESDIRTRHKICSHVLIAHILLPKVVTG